MIDHMKCDHELVEGVGLCPKCDVLDNRQFLTVPQLKTPTRKVTYNIEIHN